MFLTLLLVTFVTSFLVCSIVVLIFHKPIDSILHRIIADQISKAWVRYITFAIYVVGIGGGVRIHAIEQYINPRGSGTEIPALTMERWVLELYRTIIQALEAVALMLLVFFVFALIAFVLVRIFEVRRESARTQE